MAKIRTSTGWLARETIKGLPEAGKKVGGIIGKGVGMAMKAPFSIAKKLRNKINVKPQELSPEEKKERQENLNKMRETIRKYRESHPGFKTPKEFKDLE